MFFDTTISAVFRDQSTPTAPLRTLYRFNDETIGNYFDQNENGNRWGNRYFYDCTGHGRWGRCWEFLFRDNLFATLGYKSLASYTVDFRQLGTDENYSPAAHGQNNDWVVYNSDGREDLLKGQTWKEDYNTAANVDIAVSLPYDRFDAYFIKLRPALAPFVNSITVYKNDGTETTVYKDLKGTDWENNANMQTFHNTIPEDSSAKTVNGTDAGWWRINLLEEGTEIKNDSATFKPDPSYDARKLKSDGTGSSDGYYYESPSVVKETGTIEKVVLNLSVNAKAANGAPLNLWEVIEADEGTWYKEPKNPETQHNRYPYNATMPEYGNQEYNTVNQETRHSMGNCWTCNPYRRSES